MKDSPRIEAIGTVDEVNSLIGMVRALGVPTSFDELLERTQQTLFSVGGELAFPGRQLVEDAQVVELERRLRDLNEELPSLTEFVLPGGPPAAAACHIARAACRRAERRAWELSRRDPVNGCLLRYLNRLSDLLFVVARHLTRLESDQEPQWRNPHEPP